MIAEEQTREAHHEVGMSVDVTQIMAIGAVGVHRHIVDNRVVRTVYRAVGLRVAQIESFGCGHAVERIAANLQAQGVSRSDPLADADVV